MTATGTWWGAGSTRIILRRAHLAALGFLVACGVVVGVDAREAPEAAGHWKGSIRIPGAPLEIEVSLDRAEDGAWIGTISIPAQGARDVPLEGIALEGNSITFRIHEVPGDPTFRGAISAPGDGIEGEFTQAGQVFPFLLARSERPADAARSSLAGLDAVIDRALADFEVPGLALVVVAGGETVMLEGYGMRNVEEGLPVTPDSLFAIGSATKAFTTALLGVLVDEGRIDWDTPVIEYLPDFRLMDAHAQNRLTVRDLVTHRSGLPRHDYLWYNAGLSREEMFDRLRYLEPFADLRERYHYQNLMFMTAGYLAERVTGEAWEDATRRRLLTPLGMTRTNFSVTVSQRDPDHAMPYRKHDGTIERIPFRNLDDVGPAGSINSSVRELGAWVGMHLAGGTIGDRPILQVSTGRDMFTPQTVTGGFPSRPEILLECYGLGWFLESYRGHYRAHHGGHIDGFTAMVSVLPLDGVAVVALANRSTTPLPDLVIRTVMDRVLRLEPRDWLAEGLVEARRAEEATREAEKRKAVARVQRTIPSHAIADYAGEYRHPGYGVVSVRLEDRALALTFNGITNRLNHWHYDVFELAEGADDPALEGLRVQFLSDPGGEVSGIALPLEPEVEDIVFTRQPEPRLSDPAFLRTLTGVYVLDRQEATIDLRGDSLILSLPGQRTRRLIPRGGTEFTIEGLSGFSVVFLLDDESHVRELQFRQPDGVYTAAPKEIAD